MTAREPDIVEAVNRPQTTHGEGAPAGAPESVADTRRAVPAGAPEAPVGPVGSVESEAVAPPHGTPGASGAPGTPRAHGTPGTPGAHGSPGASGAHGAPEAAAAYEAAAAAGASGTPQTDGSETPAESTEDHERQLEHDLEELTAKAEKADEYLELAKRTKADFENYRRRAAREAAAAQERGIAKLAKELLPAVDNLDRALQAAQSAVNTDANATQSDNGTSTLVSGIKLVHDDVIAALARAGIEPFSPEGERFDPQEHEAIAQQPVEGAESGTVVEVYQRGYRLGEVVIRPARVVVAA